jgi:hypothetical protein
MQCSKRKRFNLQLYKQDTNLYLHDICPYSFSFSHGTRHTKDFGVWAFPKVFFSENKCMTHLHLYKRLTTKRPGPTAAQLE